jgi:cytochrome d ubiquinol oxidase subunit I
VLAGWTVTEVGRQPWTVYGVMRTADSVTPSLTGTDVLASLLGYIVVYLIMFPTGAFLMARIVRNGFVTPAKEEEGPVAAGVTRAPVVAPPGAAP